jgi:hypothetical protein
VRQGQAQDAVAGLDPDSGELGAAERAGEACQQHRAVAQPGQVGFDRHQDLARDVGGGGEFLAGQLAGIGGGAVHADGGDAVALAALGGEEGDHVGGAGRQAGQDVLVAPGASGRVGQGGYAGGAEAAVIVQDRRGGGGGGKPGAHPDGRPSTRGRGLVERQSTRGFRAHRRAGVGADGGQRRRRAGRRGVY